MRKVLLLWDVDHTLIENGGVSKENYALAFRLLVGRAAIDQPQTDGRTDVGIMGNLLTANGVDTQGYPWADQATALADAGTRNASALIERGHAMPGAEAVLSLMAAAPDVIQSSLTGNIESNARVKLGAFGLDKWIDFEVGAFGAESAVRADLVKVAQRKAATKYGFDPIVDSTVLVGDTSLDVEAALNGGARIIAVATGVSSMIELEQAGAHAVLPNLENQGAFLAALQTVREMGPVAAD